MQTRLSARLAPSGALDLLLKRAFLALWTLTQTLIPCGESQEGDHYLSSTLPSQVSFQTQLSIPLLLLETLSSSKFSGSLAERPQCSDELQSKSSQLHVPPCHAPSTPTWAGWVPSPSAQHLQVVHFPPEAVGNPKSMVHVSPISLNNVLVAPSSLPVLQM